MKTLYTLVLLGASLTAAPLFAQTKILYSSSQVKGGQPIPQQCVDAGDVLTKWLDVFPHPAKWTYVVLCDDSAWSSAMTKAMSDPGQTIFGATTLDRSLTMFRGTTLLGLGDRRITAEHLVAHELGHIMLNSHNEDRVDALALTWIHARSK